MESEEEKEWRMLNGRMDRDEEEKNKEMVLALVKQYNRFKRRNIRYFRFASEESERIFGECHCYCQTLFINLDPDLALSRAG